MVYGPVLYGPCKISIYLSQLDIAPNFGYPFSLISLV